MTHSFYQFGPILYLVPFLICFCLILREYSLFFRPFVWRDKWRMPHACLCFISVRIYSVICVNIFCYGIGFLSFRSKNWARLMEPIFGVANFPTAQTHATLICIHCSLNIQSFITSIDVSWRIFCTHNSSYLVFQTRNMVIHY